MNTDSIFIDVQNDPNCIGKLCAHRLQNHQSSASFVKAAVNPKVDRIVAKIIAKLKLSHLLIVKLKSLTNSLHSQF